MRTIYKPLQAIESLSNASALDAAGSSSTWPAFLDITLGKSGRGARVHSCSHQGPLYIQKPFYPEGPDLAHLYLLHPPGGLVSGDNLNVTLNVESGCAALFTTPGAARVYRARADRKKQEQQVTLKIANGGSGEWFPLETILFPESNGSLLTRVELERGAMFCGWEITCLGLPSSGHAFRNGKLSQRFEILNQGELAFLESFHLDANKSRFLNGKAGMQGNTVSGLFVSGPFESGAGSQRLLEQLQALNTAQGQMLATTLVGKFMVTRFLGHCAHKARSSFIRCWALIRPELLQRQACLPRIWAT